MITTYVCLLRGINVSGQKPINMVALEKMFNDLGFFGVQTYIQSGNIVFGADALALPDPEQSIAGGIQQTFGFEVPAIVLDSGKLQEIVRKNPFTTDPDKDSSFFHLTLFSAMPETNPVEKLLQKRSEGEEVVCIGRSVYLYCPDGYGKTRLTNTFIEKVAGCSATTRNWRTVNELMRMADAFKV
ncbi:MAG: DUF1697 domain-containing protein [Bacteroidales bacterium]|nr:DUF1697 domain-containing protein [Bacteroidales bacterium]